MTYFDIAANLGYTDRDAVMRSYNRYTKYLKSGNTVTPEEFMRSEIPVPGSVRLSSIVAQLKAPLPYAIERLRRLALSLHYSVTDSINGYTLSDADAASLIGWLAAHTAIKPIWTAYCSKHSRSASPAEYHSFLGRVKRKHYIVCKHHPCCDFEEYVPGSEEDVLLMFRIIYADEHEATSLGYTTIKLAGSRLGVSESIMEAWLADHPEWISNVAGVPFIKAADVDTLANEWGQCVDADLHDWLGFRKQLDEKVYGLFHRQVALLIRTELTGYHLPAKSYPQQNNHKIYFFPTNIHLVEQQLFDAYLVPVSAFGNIAYVSIPHLKNAIRQGRLDGAIINQNYYLRPEHFLRYQAKIKEYIPVETVIRSNMAHITSNFDVNQKRCWDELFRFCDHFGWWDIWHAEQTFDEIPFETTYSHTYIHIGDTSNLCRALDTWLRVYGTTPAEEFETRLRIHKKDFPIAVKELKKAFPDADSRTISACEMIDMLFYLLSEVHQDIDILSKSKSSIENLIEQMRSECSITASTNFVDFLNRAGYFKGSVSFARIAEQKDVSAYSISAFTVIAAAICSPGIWEEQDLVQKAIRNPKYAQLWLYVALHIFSALRSTDYTRLQAPSLDVEPSEILAQIEAGTFPTESAQKLSIMFVSLNSYFRMRPHKTSETQNVLPLYFHVPTDCDVQFGTILAIALAHYTLDGRNGNFIVPSASLAHQKEFFGTPFIVACGNTAFSGRRANKALMQLVSITAQEELSLSPDIAYSLASSLRSHKGGYAKLSETTYRYLNNSRFSGLDGQFVINHMFQRGSCSFIIDHMLKTYFKDQYQDLPIHLQTEAIQKLGLSAHEVSEIEHNTKLALHNTETTIKELVNTSAASGVALSNLIGGKAKARDGSAECLLKALGKPCAKESYQHCVACKYELRNKAQYVHYYMEFIRLTQEIKSYTAKIEDLKRRQDLAVTVGDYNAFDPQIAVLTRCLDKARWLRNKTIYPCLLEIESHIRSFADEHVLESYTRLQKKLVERESPHGT